MNIVALRLIARRIWQHLLGQIVTPLILVIILLVIIYFATIVGCYLGIGEKPWFHGREFHCKDLHSSDALHYIFPWWPVRMQ